MEIKDASEMGKLAQALEKEGFTIDEIEKIYYKNALRFLIETSLFMAYATTPSSLKTSSVSFAPSSSLE